MLFAGHRRIDLYRANVVFTPRYDWHRSFFQRDVFYPIIFVYGYNMRNLHRSHERGVYLHLLHTD